MVKFSKRLALILVVFLAFQLVLPGNFFWQNAGGYSDERDAIVEKQLAEIISDNESKGELKEQEREAGLEELVEEKEGREQGVFPEEIEETEEGGFIEKNRVTEQGGFQEENEEKEQYELAEEKEGTEAVGFDVVNYDCDGNIVSVAKKGIYVSEEGFHEYEYVENLPPKIISEPVTFFEIDKRKGELQLLDLSNWKAINLGDGLKANWVVDATGTEVLQKDGASVTLNWNESYDNIKVSGYSIYRDGKIIATVDASSQTYTDIVEPGAYRYFVTAFDPSGNESGSSNEVIFDCEKPSRPGNVVRTNATVSTITISWEPSYDLTGVKGYKVYRDGEMIGVAEEEYFTDSGLEPDTVYTYAVKAFDGYENESEISGKLTAATKADTEPPTVPENLRILLQTGTSIIFNWSESEDNFKVAGYEIYRNGEHVGNSNVPSYTDAGVSAGTTYTYTVRAFDGAGNYSNFSSELIGIPMMPKIVGTEPLDEETIGGLSEKVYVYFLDSGNMTGSSALFEYSRDGITWSKFDSEVHGPNRKDPVTLYFYSNWDLESLKSGDYMVRCTVYDADGNSDERIVSYRVDRTPPEKVKNLNAISDSSSVVLTWDASEIDIPEDDIAPVVLGISPVDGTTFGKNAKITGLFASPYTTNIILMWNDVYDDDFAYFSVEQKDSLDGEYKKAGTIDNRLRMNTVDFMKEEKLKKLMEVTAVGNGWVRLNDESTNLPQNYKDSFEYGTEIKLTAIPDRDSEFAYWEDISNGRMISTNPVYRTIITSGENIKAVFYKKATEETEVFTVVFKDRGGRILKSTNVAKNQPAIPPKDPVMTGYQFVGWDRDFSSVTSNMVISPVFKRLPDKYIVTVEGGRLITGETKGEYKFDMPVKVVANEEEEGMKFSHWTMDGRKVSLEPEYVFFMPKKDIVLTAVFVEDAEIIDTAPFITLSEDVIVNKDDKTMIFVANRSVGEGYTLIESGVILLKAGADYEGEITLGTENILRGRIHNDSTDQFYVRKINVADGDIWYGRAYLIYEDGDGNIFTVYSENTAKGIMK
ncbi:fibronectin type III domain-containing protein [Acetivibrio saccincola]|uniref:Exoglucanase B n=1 Tax=Acetivibrio saccincola TaxID=1677857 RepID=A0A2K9ECE8_9FIRM|nr:InlB B-repeat-containing protein [Acetivibrio saccincola]AUG57804.1 Exoglucanase B precursor [Acetivibrio saccincola]